MKMLAFVPVAALLATGCSSADEGEPAPTACNKTDRSGTYRQSFVTQNGDCGDLEDQIVSFDAPAGPAGGGGCSVTGERWSENDCKLERTTACTTPTGRSTGTFVSRQQTANGSTITGVGTISVRLNSGSSCTGTYAITAVRQ